MCNNKQIVIEGHDQILYQWDTGQRLRLHGYEPGTRVDFARCNQNKAASVYAYAEGGAVFCDIPDAILMEPNHIRGFVYVIDGGKGETVRNFLLPVIPRPKPEDYVEPEEVPTWHELEQRIKKIEDEGVPDEKIERAVEDYLEENPIEAPKPDLTGVVKSVNGKTPDENGNVEITIPDSSQNVNQYAFLNGKKYYAFGDSIVDMQGTLTNPETFGDTGYTSDLQSRNIKDITVDGYVTAIERRYGLVATNYGKGGQTLVGGYPTLATLDYSDVALVTIAYGVNDARTSVPLGTVNSNDVTTFAGAMNNLLRKIYTDNPECRVVILTPIQRLYVSDFGIGTANANGQYLIDFVDMCKKVAAKRSTKCIDMYRDCGINQTNLYYYTVEGVHPVNQGFARMRGAVIPVLDDMFAMEFEPFGTMTNAGDTEPDEPDIPDTGGDEQPPVEEPTGTEVDMTGMFLYEGYSMDGWGTGKNSTEYQHARWVPLPSKTYTIKTYVALGLTDFRFVSWSIYNEDGTVKSGNYGTGKIGAVAVDHNDTEIIGTNEYTVLKITLTTNSTWEDGIVVNIPCLDECVPHVKCSYI